MTGNNKNYNKEVLGAMAPLFEAMFGEGATDDIIKSLETGEDFCMVSPFGVIGQTNNRPHKPNTETPRPNCGFRASTIPRNIDAEAKHMNDKAKEMNEIFKKSPHKPEHRCQCLNSVFGAANVYTDSNGGHKIVMLLPGFKKEEISVSYIGDILTVKATHEQTVAEIATDNGGAFVSSREEFKGAEVVNRKFTFKDAVFEQTKMTFENGVLTITIPAPVKPTIVPTVINFD